MGVPGIVTLHAPERQASPPKQSVLVLHAAFRSPLPSGLHWVPKPTMAQRNPSAHSASLWQVEPAVPLPPGRAFPLCQARPHVQMLPAAHSPLRTHAEPAGNE